MFDNYKMKKFILDKGIKQKKISEISSIPEPVISLILSGKRKCNIEEYVSLCFALNVPIGEFIQNEQQAS